MNLIQNDYRRTEKLQHSHGTGNWQPGRDSGLETPSSEGDGHSHARSVILHFIGWILQKSVSGYIVMKLKSIKGRKNLTKTFREREKK